MTSVLAVPGVSTGGGLQEPLGRCGSTGGRLQEPLACCGLIVPRAEIRNHNLKIAHTKNGYRWSSYSRERERNVLFNDTLNTFYLGLNGIRHMVKDHSDSENQLPPYRLLFPINSKSSFICTIPQTG